MRTHDIAVLGGGVSGLSAALLLAREGHRVTLIERDAITSTAPDAAFTWERNGIPHFQQPHAFIARGRKELIERFGDVYSALHSAGASDVDSSRKLPGARVPADSEFQYIAVRRPIIEWALRGALRAEPNAVVRGGGEVRGLRIEHEAVTGVEWEGGACVADVVIDAMGRRSPVRGWVAEQLGTTPRTERSECGVIYYSRYYKLREGRTYPDGPWFLGPRGDLGYMGFTSFPGDNGTFAAVLAVPTGVSDLKVLRHEKAFEAAVAKLPALSLWANPDLVEPITTVLPMGGLQNAIAFPSGDRPFGLFTVGDALCHTDPALAQGLSFGLIHANAVREALREHATLADAGAGYLNSVMPELKERYALATALDEQRLRMWKGDPVDFKRRDGDYELFSLVATGAVALSDPEVFRAYMRRFGLLESTRVFDDDIALQQRIESSFQRLLETPRAPAGPSRGEMLELTEAALAG